MKITISQNSYAVRDASEIAFGLLVLGIFLPLAATGLGLIVSLGITAIWPQAGPNENITSLFCSLLLWLGMMWLVVRRYQRIAAQWTEERRGSSVIHLVEWITVLLGLLFSQASAQDGGSEGATMIRAFLGGLMMLLLLSHIATYCLLRYRPRLKELVTWTALMGALVIELSRL